MKENGTTAQKYGSGRPRTTCRAANIDNVNDVVLSQEGAPQTPNNVTDYKRNWNSLFIG